MAKKSVSVQKNLERLVNSLNEERNTKMDTFFETEEDAQPKPSKKKCLNLEIFLSYLFKIGLSISKVELSLLKISKQNKTEIHQYSENYVFILASFCGLFEPLFIVNKIKDILLALSVYLNHIISDMQNLKLNEVFQNLHNQESIQQI